MEIVKELLRRHIDVNQPTHKGNTALHIASLAGQFEVAKVLIENGALVNAQSQVGFILSPPRFDPPRPAPRNDFAGLADSFHAEGSLFLYSLWYFKCQQPQGPT